MQDHVGMSVFSQVERSMADRREIAQEAYDAYEFGVKVVASQPNGFFFSFHKQRPVMARKIHVMPDSGGMPVSAFFCVAFAGTSLRVTEAFAFTGSDSYFGHLPDQFVDGQPEDDDNPPRMMI